MSSPTVEPGGRAELRQVAQQRLVEGLAPPSRGWGVSVEALALLHRLASTPASAADALKLLHELQVHQVELDLQQAQLEANEHELAEELARYRGLYEHSPVPHVVLDGDGRIVECNRAGAGLLGAQGTDLAGRPFDAFLAPKDRAAFAALLDSARCGAANPACILRPAAAATRWRIAAGAVAGSDTVQLAITDAAAPREG